MDKNNMHPEVKNVMEIFEDLKVPDFYKGSPDQARELFRGLRPAPDTLPPIYKTTDIQISIADHQLTLRTYRPSDAPDLPVLMWFHGGGWVFGDLESGELACREMAHQADCAIVSVDYRLAPESRFPVALNDCIQATDWVRANAAQLGVDAKRMAVGGDSAGGNLAACVAHHARDNDIELAHQLLVYPVTQPSFETDSYQRNATGYFLSKESMIWFWDHYAPDESMRADPRVSPLHGKHEDLAPAWVFTCGLDPLCDDGAMYAQALSKAGVPVQTYHRDDSIHGVFGMAIEPGALARREAAGVLRSAFA